MADDEPATFWLTDFLARNFERLVIRGLGIDRHPELEPMYFANYRRLVYLSQTDDPDLLALARAAADAPRTSRSSTATSVWASSRRRSGRSPRVRRSTSNR